MPIENLEDLSNAFKDYGSAIEFAGVETMTRVAKRGQGAARDKLDDEFELRNRWTRSGIKITPATVDRPWAEVYTKDRYIADHEEGTTRPTRDGGQPVPAEIYKAANLDERRVIPKGWRKRNILERTKSFKHADAKGNKPFVQKMKNTLGVWIRDGAKRLPVTLLYTLQKGIKKIKKNPFFFSSVNDAYESHTESEYNAAVDRAVARFLNRYR